MNKIGILTFHCADNFGAVLQCYALQEALIKLSDYSVEVVDYNPDSIVDLYRLYPNPFNNKHLSVKRKIIETIKTYYPSYLSERISKKNKFDNFRYKRLNVSRKKYFTHEDFENDINEYDYLIVGSDQVWNTEIGDKIDSVYFLDFDIGKTIKVSYAASTGKELINPKHIERVVKLIEEFDSVSLREESSKNNISNYTDKSIEIVLDPTLLLSKEEWEKIESDRVFSEEYILVYNLEFTNDIIEIADFISMKLDLPVISYTNKKHFNNGVKSFEYSGPEEFVSLFKNASYIITNSFHGTVFSIIFEKSFITVPHTTRGARMVDLLDKLGLNNRIANNVKDLQHYNLLNAIDYELVNSKLNTEVEKSKLFLEKSISLKKE